MSVDLENINRAIHENPYPGITPFNFGVPTTDCIVDTQVRYQWELGAFDNPPPFPIGFGLGGGLGGGFDAVGNWRNFLGTQLWTELTKTSGQIAEDNKCLFKAPTYNYGSITSYLKAHPDVASWFHLQLANMDVLVPPDSFSKITVQLSDDGSQVIFTFAWKITQLLVWYSGSSIGYDYVIHDDVFKS